jgi:hypothetical protein
LNAIFHSENSDIDKMSVAAPRSGVNRRDSDLRVTLCQRTP